MLVAAPLALALLTSCTPRDARLRSLTAATIECPEADISVADIDRGIGYSTWRAQCREQRFRCRSQQETSRDVRRSRGATSTARHSTRCEVLPSASTEMTVVATDTDTDTEPTAETESQVAPADGQAGVQRLHGPAGTRLTLTYVVDGITLTFTADPTSDDVHWRWQDGTPAGELSSCRVGLIVDGEVVTLPGSPGDAQAQRSYEGVVSAEALGALAASERGAGRLCEREWRLDEAGRGALRDLLARRTEERAWNQAGAGVDVGTDAE